MAIQGVGSRGLGAAVPPWIEASRWAASTTEGFSNREEKEMATHLRWMAMGRGSAATVALWAMAALVAMGLVAGPVNGVAQEPASPASGAAAKDSATPEAGTPKRRSEPRGRLPAYYGEVIDNQQREKIYDIQSRILAQIGQLQQQIAQLEQQRDAEVVAVLTAEQAAKVKELTEAAKTKRMENAKRRKPAAAAPAGAADASTAANTPAAKP